MAANGRPLVKLSDDAAKSTGDSAEVARYRRIFAAPQSPARRRATDAPGGRSSPAGDMRRSFSAIRARERLPPGPARGTPLQHFVPQVVEIDGCGSANTHYTGPEVVLGEALVRRRTDLTNDCGLPTCSLVVKPVAANGRPLVKRSDKAAKSTVDSAEVARYRRIFDCPAVAGPPPRCSRPRRTLVPGGDMRRPSYAIRPGNRSLGVRRTEPHFNTWFRKSLK